MSAQHAESSSMCQHAQSFSSIVAEQVAGLAERCERFAKEREASLRAEIGQLREDNAQLRSRLQATNGNLDAEPVWPQSFAIKPGAEMGTSLAPTANESGGGKPSKENDVVPLEKDAVVIPTNNGQEQAKATSSSCVPAAPAPHPGSDVPERASVRGQAFQLLPELLKDHWTAEDVVDSQGAYFERDATPTALAQRCLLDPASETKLAWDIIGIPILGWDLITIPMQVFSMGAIGAEIMDGAGWVTLFYWTFDMPVTFITGYFDLEGDLVMDHKKIAKHYMHGFFFLDFIIIMGDWLTLIIESIGSDAPGFLSNLSVLRALRISRFIRLMRLRKLKSKIQALEDNVDNEWMLVIFNLIQKVFSILIINHYIGCIWYWISTVKGIEEGNPTHRWISSVPWPQYGPSADRKVMLDAPWDYQYLTSLHWAIAQFTPGPQNIQPQNSVERVYAILILLFGMVVFSSFIASVTQARMQLNKMMSKFERDNWLLRKFCRQHKISRELQCHMKRYIDLVVIPNYHKLTMADVVLLPKLSAHLRAQLNTELASQHLCVHPFFQQLLAINKAVMNSVCNTALEAVSLARGDVAFCAGEVATHMFIVTTGVLEYIPVVQNREEVEVKTHHWCAEAVLWTKWTHQGQLQASIESTALSIKGASFRAVTQQNGFVSTYVRAYGLRFCEGLTLILQAMGMPSDLHEQVALDINYNSLQPQRTWLETLAANAANLKTQLP